MRLWFAAVRCAVHERVTSVGCSLHTSGSLTCRIPEQYNTSPRYHTAQLHIKNDEESITYDFSTMYAASYNCRRPQGWNYKTPHNIH